ncbi:MAG: hypothetical protein K9N34_06335, partial [Candidatus Marinimicrobia bacterium]|nr:hypothetical protein [Candidatus Neomarinimicrobiota bacterium]MCF7840182.1 hypothetical protein [Candidatus Neomarinimicrobiota bacterium]
AKGVLNIIPAYTPKVSDILRNHCPVKNGMLSGNFRNRCPKSSGFSKKTGFQSLINLVQVIN